MQSKYKKILIIRLGAIGDVINSLIIHQAIKEKHPDVEIHYLTLDYIAPLLENDPHISKLWTIEDAKKKNLRYILNIGLELRKERYDAVISLTNSIRNKLLNLCTGSKKIAKRGKAGHKEHSVKAFYNSTKVLFDDLEIPERVKLTVSEGIKDKVYDRIKNFQRPFIVLNPGGAHDNERQGRIWPEKNWIETGNRLVDRYGGTVFIVGAKSEKEAHKSYLKIKNSVLFSGELSLVESAALYSYSDIFISVDSGPLHIAAALGKNVLGIMGSTSGTSCGPYSPYGTYVSPTFECAHCHQKKCPNLKSGEIYAPCISSITPEMVLEKVIAMQKSQA